MNKSAFVLAALIAGVAHAGGWERTAIATTGQIYYLDYDRISPGRLMGEDFRFWLKVEAGQAKGVTFSTAMDQIAVNCADVSFRTMANILYDKTGNVISSPQVFPLEMQPAAPESNIENLINKVCSYGKTRFR